MTHTAEEKLQCIEREINMRHRVYTRWVASGRMKQADAEREISLMQSIAEDYKLMCVDERLI